MKSAAGRPGSVIAAYWRTNLTLHQLASLLEVSKSAADRIIDHLGFPPALQQRERFHKENVLIVEDTVVPTRDHSTAEQSKNHRYSINHQVVINADTRRVVAVGRPLPGNRNNCKTWELPGSKAAVGNTTVIADSGYRCTGLAIPHRREPGQAELPAWKEEHNTSRRKVRARVEHTFGRMRAGRSCVTAASKATASATHRPPAQPPPRRMTEK